MSDDRLVIRQDHPAYPGRFIAQLTTESPLPYVLAGDTLAEVQAQLPPGLVRYGRRASYPPKCCLEIVLWLTL
jgi:hypothetical protein